MEEYYVYILTNERHTVLYIGITNCLERRLSEHVQNTGSAFTKKYNVKKLVYYEIFTNPEYAIKREKQLKKKSRIHKEKIINNQNPMWRAIDPATGLSRPTGSQ